MNEYKCLGVELKHKEGRYWIEAETEEAKQALERIDRYSSANGTNPRQMLEKWVEVIKDVAAGRAREHLKSIGWNEAMGCFQTENILCTECVFSGKADLDKGCIFIHTLGGGRK